MAEKKVFSADSLDDAITQATIDLCVTSEHLGYNVLDKGAKGFLGIGARKVIIEAWDNNADEIKAETKKEEKKNTSKAVKETAKKEAKENKEPAKKEVKAEKKEEKVVKTTANDVAHFEEGKKFLLEVFEKMGMTVSVEYKLVEDDTLEMNLSGEDMGVLIGKRGQTLDSLQYLTSLVVNKSGEHYIRVKLDTENYRERRKETLESLAKNVAYKVKRTKKSVSLEPMNPYERRIIHSCLQPDNFVMTKSEGEEPYRHVVVFFKRNRNGEER